MRIVCIIQARINSTRLPGKVLLPLAGREVLGHILDRLAFCQTFDEIIVATSNTPPDDVLAEWCARNCVQLSRGSLDDVLDRIYQCALQAQANAIVRITADCPLLDPTIVDEVVQGFLIGNFDLFYLGGEFPDGLDCAVCHIDVLEKASKGASLKYEREHVFPYVLSHPEIFRIGILEKFKGCGGHRWTLDEAADLVFLSKVFERLQRPDGKPFLADDILDLLKMAPELMSINQGILRNEGLLKSMATEKRN